LHSYADREMREKGEKKEKEMERKLKEKDGKIECIERRTDR
jgi:hypothetical protein